MRAVQSRVGLLSSLDSAGKGVSRCVQALPLPGQVLRVAGAVSAGFAGVMLLRLILPSRRPAPKALPVAAAVPARSQPQGLSRYLVTETIVMLLLPLLRRYLLGRDAAAAPATPPAVAKGVDKLVSRLMRLIR